MVSICGREQDSKSGHTANNMWCLFVGENKTALNPMGENKSCNTANNMWCLFVGENKILNPVILLTTCGVYVVSRERTRF